MQSLHDSPLEQSVSSRVRRALTGSITVLSPLTALALSDAKVLSAAGAVLLDRVRYRLAHVAMRHQLWEQASMLLKLRGQGRSDDEALRELVLLCQGSEPQLLDQLYEDQGRLGTTGLKLFIKPERGRSTTVVMSEWLAQSHLDELAQEGWLVVDTTVESIGEQGRGSELRCSNFPVSVLMGLAQVLADAATVPHGGNRGLSPGAVQDRFQTRDEGRLVDPDNQPRWEYVTSGVLKEHPDRKVIRRERSWNTWRLEPPYVVVLRDSATAVRQAAGRSQ